MSTFAELLGETASIVAVRERLRQILGHTARSGRLAPILLQGETGTGKGLLARAIHREGPRQAGPFVDVNCAAIPETLLESELFGFERGAFTDARSAKPGLFQTAHHGTIFLDEVNLISETVQTKLLKVIEERTVRRLGATHAEPLDVLIVAATNADLEAAVRSRCFRADLYHRLAVLTMRLPPLRDRKEDVLLLAEHFLARACADYRLSPRRLSAASRAALLACDWPGNVRELANVIERAALASDAPVIEPRALELPAVPMADTGESASPEPTSFHTRIGARFAEVERQELLRALHSANGNVTRTAAALGITRNTLRYRLDKHGLSPNASAPTRPVRRRRTAPTEPMVDTSPMATAGAAVGPADMGPRWERRLVALLQAVVAARARDEGHLERRRPIEILVGKIQSFGGSIEELGATGLLAAFGAEGMEDAPNRATVAAMAACNALLRWDGEGARASSGVRAAVHVAQVMTGHVASGIRIDVDAKRSAGALLEALIERAEDGAIVVSEATAAFLRRRFDLAPLHAPLAHPELAYRIVGRARGGFAAQMLSPFVGRESELGELHDRLSRTEGGAQVVGIVGEAGIGKSRLLYEFRQGLEGHDIEWLEASCASYTADVPYSAIVPLMRQACGILDTDDSVAVDGKVRRHLTQRAMNQPEEDGPYLGRLIAGEGDTVNGVDTDQRRIRSRTFEAVRRVLLNTARLRPTVVVLEDAHWADGTSEDCFLSLVASLGGARVLFIATYRPDHRPPWMDRPAAAELTLPPLAHDDCLAVLRSVVNDWSMSDSVVQVVLTKAAGNPFFLEELASEIRRQRVAPWAPAEVPATIQQVLQARIDHLDETSRCLIQTASILGPKFSLDLLEAVWESPPLPRHGLQALAGDGFVLERSEGSEPQYVFKHALIQEVAHDSIAPSRRQALHLAAARSLEHRYADRLDEISERLAYHYSRSGDARKAVQYLTRFAQKSARSYALLEAVRALLEALHHVERLPAGSERDQLFKDLVMRQPDALQSLGGRPRESLEVLLRQRAEVERLRDPVVTSAFYLWLGWMSMPTGDYELATSSAERAVREAELCGNGVIAGKAFTVLGHASYYLGHPREGLAHGREAVRRLETSEEPSWEGLAWYVTGLNAHHLGEFWRVLDAADHLEVIATAIDNPRFRFGAKWLKGLSHAMEGQWDAGIAACRSALETAPRPLDATLASFFLAFALLENGHAAQAIALLEPSLPQFERFQQQSPRGLATSVLAEAYRLTGDPGRAREWALEGLRLCRQTGARAAAGFCQRVLGRVAQEHGDLVEAERRVDEALQTFTVTQAQFEQARTRLVCADVADARGRHQSAEEHRREALGLFEALRVPYWANRARQALSTIEARHAVP